MTILRDISIMWSLFHVIVVFAMLYESRFPKKTTVILTSICSVVWLVTHGVLLYFLGPTRMTQLIFLTGTVPSFLFFLFMAKNRNGRFIFTFCLCDTLSAEILLITNLIDYYLFGGKFIAMFVLRLLLFPILEYFAYKWIRPTLIEVQRSVRNGWYSFSAISIIFYILLILLSSYPSDMVNYLPERLPIILLTLILMPLLYWNIFRALRRQQKLFAMTERDNLLRLQVSNMKQRIEQMTEADEKFRIERHDMRHKLKMISELAQNNKLDELCELVDNAEKNLDTSVIKHYCANSVLDSVLAVYISNAEKSGVKIHADLSIPAELSVDSTELSMVFANAIENAINASLKLPEEKRVVEIRAIAYPKLMFSITNLYSGDVIFNERGIPVSDESGHGFGTRSIVAFCEKNNAFWEFKAENGTFSLRIVFE